jgi:integrase
LRIAPLVFVRAGELVRAEWEEIDFTAAEWRIPASKMKMKQMRIVPLSRQALALLEELRAVSGNERYVFPAAGAFQA